MNTVVASQRRWIKNLPPEAQKIASPEWWRWKNVKLFCVSTQNDVRMTANVYVKKSTHWTTLHIVNEMRNSLGIRKKTAIEWIAAEKMEGHPSTGRNLLRDSRELENGRCSSSRRELKREGPPPVFRYRPSEKEWNRLDDAKSRKRENGMPKSQSVCRVYRWKERERESVPYGRRANNPVLFQVNAIQLTKINFFFLFSLHRGPFRASI